MSHAVTNCAWQTVGTFGERDYLLTVDYLTGFFEIKRLPSKRVTDIIYCLRHHFAQHGLPLEVISNNSPFASAEFKRFADRFDFKHITSIPMYPQSNGRVENAIKTVKSIMPKAREANTDPFLALLDFRNIPSEPLEASPAQLMFGR